MSDLGDVRVSRSDIARMAGVKRPAVTNWERRHADFPAPVGGREEGEAEEVDTFRADEVLRWLSGRTIPANALRPGEPTGATYGDRFRVALGGGPFGGLLSAIDQVASRDADRLRGTLRLADYLRLLLNLLYTRTQDGPLWARFMDDPEWALGYLGLSRPEESGPSYRPRLSHLLRLLDANGPASADEGRQAFDLLLARLRNTDAQEADEYFTPQSVSRVMARALADPGAPARRLYDPFCRTGELLCAYLDAVAEQGGKAPEATSGHFVGDAPGKAPDATSGETVPDRLSLVMMNFGMRGFGKRAYALPGAREPYHLGEVGTPRGLLDRSDVVITNPPFGGPSPRPGFRPRYWRYGVPRSSEFDWLQYVVSVLAHDGRAAVLMPAGAASRSGADQEIRARMVEDGVVECVMALPGQLFELTAIQTHIWFLRRPPTRSDEVLFVDGSDLGAMATRTRRELADTDVDRLVRAYTSRSGHLGVSGLSRAVRPAEIAGRGHRLAPALYVRGPVPSGNTVDDRDAARRRLTELTQEIERLRERARTIDAEAEEQLRRYGL